MASDQVRTFRCGDELWSLASARAGAQGMSVSSVIRSLLAAYGIGALADHVAVTVTEDDVVAARQQTAELIAELKRAGFDPPHGMDI